MDLKLRAPALKTFSIYMCWVPNRTEAVLTWAKSWLLLIVQDSRDEKEDQPWRLCPPVSRGGLLVCRWRSSHCIPLLCPQRQVGLWAAGQGSWLGNGYLRATGKVSHLRITHSQKHCVKKEHRQKRKTCGRVAVLSCSLYQNQNQWAREDSCLCLVSVCA